jgi:ribosomal protein L29
MAIIKKNDLSKMTAEEATKKITELNRVLLELEGEGKKEKRKPVKKAIAQLKTILTQKKALNKSSAL